MDGIIIINKAPDMTSHDVVSRLRHILHEKRIGHAGTLDPMATGILPVAIGKATRLAEYIGEGTKTYIADICFGIETDSYDRQGSVISECDCSGLSLERITEALAAQTGEIMQIPPMVSAIKVNGQPLYKLAREGKSIERAPRSVTVSEIKILDAKLSQNPRIICEITCSKGTYIRSIAHDAGKLLHCGAHLQALQRTRVGRLELAASYTLEQIETMFGKGNTEFLLPAEEAVSDMPQYHAGAAELRYVLHGNSCRVDAADQAICAVFDEKGLIGIGHIETGILFMDKVLRDI